ncbi:uncharacterized protein LOC142999586 [Genypterus blacodes]|uniref:uncharacterized protein LOC142999586 n=1 Tax=Genypterus blacodes TaxID=154954 RepID=UPI003F766CC4
MTGEVEPSCVPCHDRGTIRKECAASKHQSSKAEIAVTVHRGNVQELQEKRGKEGTFSTVLIGSATASSMFLLALLLWAFLLTAEKFKQVAEYCHRSEVMASGANLQCSLLSSPTDRAVKPPEAPTQAFAPAEDPPSCLNSLSHKNEVHPTSIVINVTTNIKPGCQNTTNTSQEEQGSSCYSTQEMEQNLQKIWEVAQGQGIEILDYDSVQDLSLLLDAADNRGILRRLGRSLGVPPQVVANLQCFQDLFQYLRTSTYILLPQLAQAAALLPNPEIVARIHQAVVNK